MIKNHNTLIGILNMMLINSCINKTSSGCLGMPNLTKHGAINLKS